MSLPSTLRLDRLELKNYRCFADVSVDLHPQLTVLVADNGFGKTALLDGAALALSTFVDAVSGTTRAHGFAREDVRVMVGPDRLMSPCVPTALSARGTIDGQRVTWERELKSVSSRARTTTADAKAAQDAALGLRRRLETFAAGQRSDAPPLPLVALYGTGRLWDQERLTEKRKRADRQPMGRLSGYIDCLSPSSSFKAFRAWYEVMSKAARDATVTGRPAPDRPELLVAAVREATSVVLGPTQWSELDWQFAPRNDQGRDVGQGYLVVEHPEHGRLPVSALSDGVRNMVALVADVAHRCARLNPHFGTEASRLTPGVLLVDEVDMHLHPRWQQRVLELLPKAFPAMQMVVTTHSPQVLSTVESDSIRVIRHRDGIGVLDTPKFQTRGVESADVLASIMGVDPIPSVPEAGWLSEYRALIEDGRAESSRGVELRAKLSEHFGSDHPVMLECARLIRFQAIKRRRAGRSEGSESE